MIEFQNVNKILIIKLRAIGDVLLSTPVIENLKTTFPHIQIDFIVEKFAGDVLKGNPWLTKIHTFSKKEETSFGLIKKIRSERYDVVFDLFVNPRTALVTRLSGAKFRVGFPFRGRTYAYNFLVPPRGGEVHNVDFNLDALRFFQIPIVTRNPFFPIDSEAKKFAELWLHETGLSGKKIIAFNAGGGWITKKWRIEQFAQLADTIKKNFSCEILLFWGPGEFEEIEHLKMQMRHDCFVVPKTSLKQMGALLLHCSALISNDSGPMHIAAAVGVPTLGIFGPTNPYLQGPLGEKNMWIRNEKLDCLGCNLTVCKIGNLCMTELSVETVYTAFQQLLKRNNTVL